MNNAKDFNHVRESNANPWGVKKETGQEQHWEWLWNHHFDSSPVHAIHACLAHIDEISRPQKVGAGQFS